MFSLPLTVCCFVVEQTKERKGNGRGISVKLGRWMGILFAPLVGCFSAPTKQPSHFLSQWKRVRVAFVRTKGDSPPGFHAPGGATRGFGPPRSTQSRSGFDWTPAGESSVSLSWLIKWFQLSQKHLLFLNTLFLCLNNPPPPTPPAWYPASSAECKFSDLILWLAAREATRPGHFQTKRDQQVN